jgi:hypothetical protein
MSRHLFLSVAFDTEMESQKELSEIVKTLVSELHSRWKEVMKRIVRLFASLYYWIYGVHLCAIGGHIGYQPTTGLHLQTSN